MTTDPKTIFCYECRKAFRTANGCRSHGNAKKHQWQTPAGAVISIALPLAPPGLAAELSSQVVTLAAHVQGERITSQLIYCPMCSRRWGTWFELNRHYFEAHPAMEDVLRSQCGSPGPLVIEDEDDGPAEARHVNVFNPLPSDPGQFEAPNVKAQSTTMSDGPAPPTISDDTTLSLTEGPASIAVLEYPAAELGKEQADPPQGDTIPVIPANAANTVTSVASDAKKAKKARKAEKEEKKARKAASKVERKAKKAAERAARVESSQAAGIDSIDAIKDQISDLKKAHKSFTHKTATIVDRLTVFHDGILSLQRNGVDIDHDGDPTAPSTAALRRTEDVTLHLSDDELLHIFALRHGVDVSSKIRDLLASKDAAVSHLDSSQPADVEDVPSPTTSLPKSLSDSWEKAMFDELRASSNGAEDAQGAHTNGSPSLLRCRLCMKDVCDEPVATPCGHVFCHRCIGKELIAHTKCPVCQHTVLLSLALD
ncbi:hypothetical protein L226DRAFT_537784 [Lentinus tigrinus ALCF2SS1-7]|uniref:RING-type domain-containing protein n=1 Tax=Lentinus tigrinus ALCF2SS1-6 TaxID=1328759 RepID=A0A5C2S2A6_9APHY|nr:hypothetical protein L227DRAFT_578364 [Lentinus tigrinus ALCF2SS1-6]RPD71785.1 hypothetical protein L226DRAFT_537784 [Lentinus tigrinus ALCF2SS1-7]